jgi:membrane protease YdiL (CAAX protease family)
LLPPILLIGIQILVSTVVSAVAGFVYTLKHGVDGLDASSDAMYKYAEDVASGEFTFIAYSIIGIVILIFWMNNLSKERRPSFKISVLKGWMLPLLIIMAAASQVIAGFVGNLTFVIFPEAGQKFIEMTEAAGLGKSVSIGMLFYAAILGPIVEELCFRGLSFRYAREKMSFLLANILQAVLFGAFHMNLIQGIYTFLLGLVLGYVMEKSGNLTLTIAFHILFNALSFVYSWLMDNAQLLNAYVALVILLVSMLVLYYGLRLFGKIVDSWKGQTIDKIVE